MGRKCVHSMSEIGITSEGHEVVNKWEPPPVESDRLHTMEDYLYLILDPPTRRVIWEEAPPGNPLVIASRIKSLMRQ